jgi:SAM-dependent methyltransferase
VIGAIANPANAAQIELWNTSSGESWVLFQDDLDRLVQPLGRVAMEALAPAEGETVLDIGCGCGQTSVALAETVGQTGMILGVDVSAPMLEAAGKRPRSPQAAPIQFERMDAQTGDLGRGRFDAAFSRFGVMFFESPVLAFANIRAALKPGGRLAFVCWRALALNAWMHAPIGAAAPLLPPMPPPDPLAPGPLAFADPERVRWILSEAGYADVCITPFDTQIGGADLDKTLTLTFRIGPLGSALRQYPDHAAAVADAVRDALTPYLTPHGVMMPAAVWVVTARTP